MGSNGSGVSVSRCRLCGAALSLEVVDLGESPLSNALLTAADLAKPDVRFPLRPLVCESCWLVQLPLFEDPERIFREDYPYFSSYSSAWLDHVRAYTAAVSRRLGLNEQSFVVEVASNDGALLRNFQTQRMRVLGVEPAANVAAAARRSGVPTEEIFLNVSTASALAARHGQADLVVANNVIAHVPDLNGFVAGLAGLLRPDGTLTLEFPHLLRMLQRVEFDTIYHEHFSYFSLAVMQRALRGHGLRVVDVEELTTHGGSLRVYARPAEHAASPTAAVARVLADEVIEGLETRGAYARFAQRVLLARSSLVEFLRTQRASGARLAGYGAAAKATTLLNYCGISTDIVPYVVDRSPHKQHKWIPGVRIPIQPVERIFEDRPSHILILAWNWADEIIDQLRAVKEWGAQFVLPLPTAQVRA